MLIGAEVRGWRYSGWSKWPPCAVNMFRIRIGSLLACREGSVRTGRSAAAAGGSPLDSGDWMRKSASHPPGKCLIWMRAHRRRTGPGPRRNQLFLVASHDEIKRVEAGGRGCNPEGEARARRPNQAVSEARGSSGLSGIFL